jgi:cytochrome b involved in lipid metabolism
MLPWRQEQVEHAQTDRAGTTKQEIEITMSEDDEYGFAPPRRVSNRRWSSRLGAVILGLGTMAAVVLGLSFYLVNRDESLLQRGTSVHANFQGTVSAASLAEHAVLADCWLLIHGNVYDLTEYAPKHPGGPEYVTDFCGMDATRDYAIEHPESLLGTIRMYLLGTYVEASASVTEEDQSNASGNNQEPSSPVESESDSIDEESSDYDSSDEESFDYEPEEEGEEEDEDETQVVEDAQPVASPNPPAPAPAPTTPLCQEQFFTASEVAAHADRDDCWYILYNVVYDFTDYVDLHPGNARRIFQECGTDATGVYANERKHDERLLVTEGMSRYIIGTFGTTSGLLSVPCQ